MKKIYLFLFKNNSLKQLTLFLFLLPNIYLSQDLLWYFHTFNDSTKEYQSHNSSEIKFSDTDSNGNLYSGGNFGSHASYSEQGIGLQFPSPDITLESNSSTTISTFIVKHDNDGNFIWAKHFKLFDGGSNITSLIVDENNDIIISINVSAQSIILDSNSSQTFTDPSSFIKYVYGTFILKLDKSGNLIFSNFYRNVFDVALTIDSQNNIYSSGKYNASQYENPDFDPNPSSVYQLPYTLNAFIMKNDAYGNFLWVKGISNISTTGIAIDKKKNIILTGKFYESFIYGNYTYQSSNEKAFLLKLNNDGDLFWFQPLCQRTMDYYHFRSKILITEENSIISAISLPGNYTKNIVAFKNKTIDIVGDLFLYKVDENSNLIWYSIINGECSYMEANNVTENNDNTLNFFIGVHSSQNPGILDIQNETLTEKVKIYTNTGIPSTYGGVFLKFNKEGKLIYHKNGFSYNLKTNVLDPNNNLFLSGNFPENNMDFNPDQEIYVKPSNNSLNSFIQKLGKCYTGTPDGDKVVNFCSSQKTQIKDLYPNTTYTTWYDSKINPIPLTPETYLENGKDYYASVQDESCPNNPTWLKVTTNIVETPQKPQISDQYLCNISGMKLKDLFPNTNPDNLKFSTDKYSDLSPYYPLEDNTKYYVSFINRNNYISCESEVTAFTVYSNVPKPTEGQNINLCPNKSYKISDILLNGENLKWYDSQGNILDSNKVISSGTYFVSQTINNCESEKSIITILLSDSISPIPDVTNLPNITGDCHTVVSTIPTATDNCSGKITATTTDALQYSIPGTYTITWKYDDGNGNIFTQTQKVIITSPALPTATSPQTFCAIDVPKISNISITGQNIIWYDNSGNVLNTATPLIDGTTYYASQTINGCESDKISIQVKVNATPLPTGNANQDFCTSRNAQIKDLAVAGTSLKFYDKLGNVLPNTTLLQNNTSYFVTQTLNSCESPKLEIKVTLTANSLPANDYQLTFCNDTTANSKTEDLRKYQENIITGSSAYSFEYFDQNNNPIADFVNRNLIIGFNIFNVKVKSADGCWKMVQLKLQLNPKPVVNLPANAEFCKGLSVNLDAGSGFKSYVWTKEGTPTPISNAQILNVSEVGKYTVEVTNNSDCKNTSSTQVNQSILANILKVEITNNDAKVLLSANGDFVYSLDNSNWQNNPEFPNLNNGSYTVYVKTKLGCIIGEMNFTIFDIPNTFTPNSDGINDTWKITGMENYPNSEITILDRFGTAVLKKYINGTFEWNGQFNGRILPTGTYWYVLKVSDGRILQGYVLIKNRN